ncbi:hypothetical protein AAFC00_004159 [Neodothiora populina]|uniref:HIT-type domain-containing protein n=1 Tax=Neodothiora populina TaxID=2781224 RepID=A0ABR3PIR2_9PEZI
MPHIEELPTTAKAAAPGYSYVVDNGYDPSKVAINPTNRKRVRISTTGAAAGPSAGDLSVRQQTAIQRQLDELDKDSHRAVNIALPRRNDGAGARKKQTTNVKRIMNSGKDFSHYLEEEEAALAMRGGGAGETGGSDAPVTNTTGIGAVSLSSSSTDPPPKPPPRASKTPIARRKSAIVPTATNTSGESSPAPTPASAKTMLPPPPPASASSAAAAAASQPTTKDLPPTRPTASSAPTSTSTVPRSDLLLAPIHPTPPPTTAEIESLLSASRLRYSAARSAPPPALLAGSARPPRRVFCEICGYWGRVKCMKCGARVCGFECQSAHDESRCIRF